MYFRGLFVCLILTHIITTNVKEDGGVLVLNEANFDSAVDQYETLIIEFYAPWCQHCQKFAPEYSKAANVLKNDIPPIYLAKVDATESRSLANRFSIKRYPTVGLFKKATPGEYIDYDGERNERALVDWARKSTGAVITTFSRSEDLDMFIFVNEVVIVLFDEKNQVFENVANERSGVSYAICASKNCLQTWGASKGNIVLFKKFDERRNDFHGTLTEEALINFINTFSNQLVLNWDEKTSDKIFNNKNPVLFLFRSEKDYVELDKLLREVSLKLKGKLFVVVTDIENSSARLAELMGIKDEDLPTIRLYDTRTDLKKYKLEGEINEPNILQLVEQWEQGKLTQNLRSQDVPKRQQEAVMTVVGKNFWKVVMDKTKDVLVEFYAPWCQYCQKFAPVLENFADDIADFENIVITKIDITNNDVEGIYIKNYPTMKLWPAYRKEPIDFNNSLDRYGLIEFLQKNAYNKFYLKEEDL
jgi:protein disulfide-isomerase A1